MWWRNQVSAEPPRMDRLHRHMAAVHKYMYCIQAHALWTGTCTVHRPCTVNRHMTTGNRYGGHVRFLCCKYWSRRKVFTCILVSNLLVVLVSLHKKLQGLLCYGMLHLEWSVVHCTPVHQCSGVDVTAPFHHPPHLPPCQRRNSPFFNQIFTSTSFGFLFGFAQYFAIWGFTFVLHPSPVCLSTGPADLLLSENQKTAKKLLLMTRTQNSVCLNSSFIILIESKCLLETKSYKNLTVYVVVMESTNSQN